MPPEEPESFVEVPLSIAIAERLEPFKAIAVKYASIIAQGRFIRIDTSKFGEYRRYLKLLQYSKGTDAPRFGSFFGSIIGYMDEVNRHIDDGTTDQIDKAAFIRKLYFAIDIGTIGDPRGDAYDYRMPYEEQREFKEYVYREVKRLRADPEAFDAEVARAWTHYESIYHQTWESVHDAKTKTA
ncbi:hypothetical protein [Paenibacillus sp.]|uniref:hypothetical protein n=1 Tax=Paenibacillus sp. TaxID=58172 RepID=UPI002D2CDFD8|nr:hypothetical protein [Paenibacillus sp.]HZG87308.1 hypothetical protein [Paenibacillus sp.]